jgi:hypothetical protein
LELGQATSRALLTEFARRATTEAATALGTNASMGRRCAARARATVAEQAVFMTFAFLALALTE